jgi:replication initiation and membrane attachment protein DnaB
LYPTSLFKQPLVSEAIAADLTEDEKRVLNWMAEHESITISDADKLLDTSWQSARRLLLELSRKRICQYIRFVPFEKAKRDPRAFFRLRSTKPLPEGAFEQEVPSSQSAQKWLEWMLTKEETATQS